MAKNSGKLVHNSIEETDWGTFAKIIPELIERYEKGYLVRGYDAYGVFIVLSVYVDGEWVETGNKIQFITVRIDE